MDRGHFRQCFGFIPQNTAFITITINTTAVIAAQNPILIPKNEVV